MAKFSPIAGDMATIAGLNPEYKPMRKYISGLQKSQIRLYVPLIPLVLRV